ncbi:BatA domain-containing protein, partial [Hymenobacter coccineus]|uniref:BatA domain-containing protein n=1 Tax=Hymenobacter coccineus TaxID=1908235 RepID=UPI00114CCB89
MLTLTSPAALLALLGLLVPLAIYLWNRRPGPEVAVGSLRWLAAGANRRLRNLKPEHWRCCCCAPPCWEPWR